MENDSMLNIPSFNKAQNVPNSTAVLILGILSIITCICYGIIGIILGVIALVLASSGKGSYEANPHLYTRESYKNLKAGQICAIIGTSLSILFIIVIVVEIMILKKTHFFEQLRNGQYK